MTQKKVTPAQIVEKNIPPSYEEANAGCPGYYGGGTFSWDDMYIRQIFIRKVYSILMLQLCTTLAVIVLFTFYTPMRIYIQTHPVLYSMSNLLFLVTYILLACCGDLRRQFPWNLILLTIFNTKEDILKNVNLSFKNDCSEEGGTRAIRQGGWAGGVSDNGFYNTKSVVLCIGITALVCLCVTIFSFQSKIDITSFQGLLFILCMVMFLCALVMGLVVPFGYVPWLHAVYASIGAVVFTMFLAFDTQLLMGNKHYTISPEEYIFATLSLYLDIVYLFTFLLDMFGYGRE